MGFTGIISWHLLQAALKYLFRGPHTVRSDGRSLYLVFDRNVSNTILLVSALSMV